MVTIGFFFTVSVPPVAVVVGLAALQDVNDSNKAAHSPAASILLLMRVSDASAVGGQPAAMGLDEVVAESADVIK